VPDKRKILLFQLRTGRSGDKLFQDWLEVFLPLLRGQARFNPAAGVKYPATIDVTKAKLYVALTRARSSVAIVVKSPGKSNLPACIPSPGRMAADSLDPRTTHAE
jgi:hypothetical protein